MGVVMEATAVIRGKDETAAAFEAVEMRIKALSKLTKGLGRDMAAANKGSAAASETSSAFSRAARAAEGLAGAVARVDSTLTAASRAGKAVAEGLPGLTKAAGAAREAASGFRVLREQLDALTLAATKLSAFKEALPTLAALRTSLNEAKTASAGFAKEMASTATPTAEMMRNAERSASAVAAAATAFREQASALLGLKAEVESLIGPLRSLGAAEERIAAQARAATSAMRTQGHAARSDAGEAGALAAAGRRGHGDHKHGGWRRFADDVLPLAGPEVLHVTKEAAHQGAEIEHERVRLRALGSSVSPEEREAMEKQALDLSTEYPLITQAELMHQSRNAVSVVGTAEEAMHIARPMTQLRVIANAQHPGQDNEEQFDQLIKGMEIKGVTQDPKEFQSYMNGIAKGLNAFGDTVSPKQYYDMFKYGRQATPMLSEYFILGAAPSVAQRMGGSSYGKGVSAFNSAVVGNRLSKKAIAGWMSIGMLDEDDVKRNKKGEAYEVKDGHHIKNWELAQTNPFEFMKIAMDNANKHGVKDPGAISAKLGQLFQNQMGAQLAMILAQQRPQIEKDLKLAHNAKGLESADDYVKNDPIAAAKGFLNELSTLAGVVTAPVMHDAAGVVSSIAKEIGEVSKAASAFATDHPDLAKVLSGGALAGSAVGGGYLLGKLFGNVFDFLKGGTADVRLNIAAGHLDEAAAALSAAAGKPGAGTPGAEPVPGGGKPGAPEAPAREGWLERLGRLLPGAPAVVEAGAGGAFLGLLAGLAGLVKAAVAAQEPGGGGAYAPATKPTLDLDEARLADMRERAAALEAQIAENRARSRNPDALPVVNGPLEDQLGELRNQIALLTASLASLRQAAPDPKAAPRALPEAHPPRDDAAPFPTEPTAKPGSAARGAAAALPPHPAMAGVIPVHLVDNAIRVDLSSLRGGLPPGYHRDFTLNNRTDGLDGPGIGTDGGTSRTPRGAPPIEALHGAPSHDLGAAAAAIHDALSGFKASDMRAVVEAPITAQVSGSAEVRVTVQVAPTSALLQAIAKASAGPMPLRSGGSGTSGPVGTTRSAAAPGQGGIGHPR